MKKCCSVCDFISEENKEQMASAAAECGFEIAFYDNAEEAGGKVADCEVIYCSDPSVLGRMKDLRWCHSANAGVGPFVKTGLFGEGKALLTNSSGAYGRAISEHIVMVTLMLMRRIPEYREITERREWKQGLRVRSIAGSNIVIIGTGDLGSNAAVRFKALGAESVTGFSRSGRGAGGFDEVFRIEEFNSKMVGGLSEKTDVLVLCVPGTPGSEGLLDAERIALLDPATFVINVGRGSVIEQEALIEALNSGRIAGAALDVVSPEPPPADDPLWTARNCLITPHTSGDMGLPYTVDKTVEFFCDNLRRYTRGEEFTHMVDVEAGY